MNPANLLAAAPQHQPRTLAANLVDTLGTRIRRGDLAVGSKLPTEAQIMATFGVSRTVVREALSRLQASGLVQTRHGIGSFVAGPADAATFRIDAGQLATARDVLAVLELRISLETEAAGLAARRRTEQNLAAIAAALAAFRGAIDSRHDTSGADFDFHFEIARATQNRHFIELMRCLGTMMFRRARWSSTRATAAERAEHQRRVHAEHEQVYRAIAAQDADAARAAMCTHLGNSRERLRRHQGK